jgi:hypothetical protein
MASGRSAATDVVTMMRPPFFPFRFMCGTAALIELNTDVRFCGDHLVPAFLRQGFERAIGGALAGHAEEARPRIDPCIGEEDIEAAQLAGGAVEGGAQRAAVGHVGDSPTHMPALRLEFRDRLIEAGPVDVDQYDPRSIVGHGVGVRIADAARRAGDDDGEAGYVEEFGCLHLVAP